MRGISALTAALLLAAPLHAVAQQSQAPASTGSWTFSVMPYAWVPSLKGTFNYGPPPANGASAKVDVDLSESDLLDALNFVVPLAGEARKGRWLIATDLLYLDLGKSDSKVQSVDLNPGGGQINVSTGSLNAGTQSSLKAFEWTLVGGYALIEEPRGNLDVIGGLRYLGLEAKTDWQLTTTVTGGPAGNTVTFAQTGNVSESVNLWSAIVGAKGRVKLGESDWFVNYYADVGGGSNVFTWQGAAGIGWTFAKWGELLLDYRYLYYSQSGDRLIDNLSLGGVQLGLNFRF